MRIEYLREYIELVHCRNFSKAAQLLNTTQSTISKHVLALEEECGADLFAREGVQITLTDEGRALFEGALRIVEEHDRLVEQVRAMGTQQASLSVGGLYHNAQIIALVAAALGRVKRTCPHAAISYREFPQESFLDIAREGKADLVFTMLESPAAADPALTAIHLFDDPLVAIVRADHEVARRGSISIEDLAEWTVLHPAGSYSIVGADIAKGICKRHGVTPQHRVVFLQSILDFPTIEIGDDLLVVERSLAHSQALQEGCVIVPFSSDDAVFPFYAAYRADNRNPLLAPFVEGLVAQEG